MNASLDWGNLILKSSIRSNHTDDDLGQPWATPLAETKLSSFLSADGNHQDDSGPEAYLSGQITDATSKYNLYNLIVPVVDGGTVTRTSEIERFQLLCNAIGVSQDVASIIAVGMRSSWSAQQQQDGASGQADSTNSVLMPVQVSDLAWYGIDPKTVTMLEPFVQLLPPLQPAAPALTTINANTAPAEVLMAGWGTPAISRAEAEQLIQHRRQKPFDVPASITSELSTSKSNPPKNGLLVGTSQYFEIYGQLRYEQHVIRERSVVYRKDQFTPVQVLRRERLPPDATVAAPT